MNSDPNDMRKLLNIMEGKKYKPSSKPPAPRHSNADVSRKAVARKAGTNKVQRRTIMGMISDLPAALARWQRSLNANRSNSESGWYAEWEKQPGGGSISDMNDEHPDTDDDIFGHKQKRNTK